MSVGGTAWWLFAAAAALDAVAAAAFLAQPIRRCIDERRRRRARAILAARVPGPDRATDRFVRHHRWLFLEECARVADTVEPAAAERAWLREVLVRTRTDSTPRARPRLARSPPPHAGGDARPARGDPRPADGARAGAGRRAAPAREALHGRGSRGRGRGGRDSHPRRRARRASRRGSSAASPACSRTSATRWPPSCRCSSRPAGEGDPAPADPGGRPASVDGAARLPRGPGRLARTGTSRTRPSGP